MDDAFCGGPDLPLINSSTRLVSSASAENVVAIILMGDPRFQVGVAFNIGNATHGGVSKRTRPFPPRASVFIQETLLILTLTLCLRDDSLPPGRRDSSAPSLKPGFSRFAILRTPFALMGRAWRRTRGTDVSTGSRP
jgi:hypothetical protein